MKISPSDYSDSAASASAERELRAIGFDDADIRDIFSIIDRHSFKPSRTQIESTLQEYRPWGDRYWLEAVSTAILALWESPAPVWCSHIYWDNDVKCYAYKWTDDRSLIIKDWDRCPVRGCHAPRPNEAKEGQG